ncbi:hypothetical protein [Lacinutrix jangbogonensis]|uniref:hypothetical protein n=1 Tax=Lacinutrix jangbogonensis TaxID=1469557 RepID=UPI00053DBA20|nr:hypothetical protein [Lacinutrix jangbogonensis]
MIDNFTFAHLNWIWPILVIALCLWLVFAWKERALYGSSIFFIHLGISFLAISSLVLIALQPQTQVKTETQIAVLLTEGFKQTQLDSLKKTDPKLDVYQYKIGEEIFDIDNIPSSLFILGHGIRRFDHWQLEAIPTLYLGGKELKGVTQLNYDYYQTKGNRLQFNGTYKNPTKSNRLLLEGPGGKTLDSLILTDEKFQSFEVSTDLNVSGNFNYHLVEKDSLDAVLSTALLPLTIVDKSPLKILMLNGSPTFESKYLKNYLAETGHQVVVKNQLTTARYKYEYFNMTSKPIINITEEKLEIFDLLIIDTRSLKAFSKRQLTTLRTVVRELGMGILIQPDVNYFRNKKLISSFKFETEKSKEANLSAFPKQNLKKYFYQFKDEFSLQPIHRSGSKIWSAYQRVGSGRVGTSVFRNTFELILNGHPKTYHALWSKIIEKISKPKTPSVQWSSSHNLAYINQPFEFELRTTIPNPIVESNEGFSIPLQRDLNVKSLWKGRVYPRKTGWKQQRVSQNSSEIFQYYVTDSLQWKAATNFNTIKANKNNFNTISSSKTSPRSTLKLVNPLWFFVIFILCAGYLWLEPKL